MKVLIHVSHSIWDAASKSYRAYGGAPGESDWLRNDLIPKIQAECTTRGISTTLVAGDLLDHPEFHQDYDAFIAPHYEANVHNGRGAFWGRAALSPTAAKDDALGALFWSGFSAIANRPPDHFDWNNVNVTDYYGFRLTTANTPGLLVEHGVGWNVPTDFDYTWLRSKSPEIANVWGRALAAFGGVALPQPVAPVATPALTLAQEEQRVYEIAEAREPLVWLARLQRGLDVERGDAYDPARPPLDPRIKR